MVCLNHGQYPVHFGTICLRIIRIAEVCIVSRASRKNKERSQCKGKLSRAGQPLVAASDALDLRVNIVPCPLEYRIYEQTAFVGVHQFDTQLCFGVDRVSSGAHRTDPSNCGRCSNF